MASGARVLRALTSMTVSLATQETIALMAVWVTTPWTVVLALTGLNTTT